MCVSLSLCVCVGVGSLSLCVCVGVGSFASGDLSSSSTRYE
jgi:hypothetical protein